MNALDELRRVGHMTQDFHVRGMIESWVQRHVIQIQNAFVLDHHVERDIKNYDDMIKHHADRQLHDLSSAVCSHAVSETHATKYGKETRRTIHVLVESSRR